MTGKSAVGHVRINGREYAVRLGPHDPNHIRRLAEHVEHRIEEIRRLTHLADTEKLLILVCLNLADEIFRTPPPATTAATGDAVASEPGDSEGEIDAFQVLSMLEQVIDSRGEVVPPWPRKSPANPSP